MGILVPTHGPPTHPGEMLKEEFLDPMGISQSELARRIGVSFQTVNNIVRGRTGVSPVMAVRLATFFDMTEGFWMNLQAMWDLYHARLELKDEKIEKYAVA